MATTDGPKPAPLCVSGSPAERDMLARLKADDELEARKSRAYPPDPYLDRDARLLDADPYAGEDETPLARTRFTPLVAALALGVLLGVGFMLVVTYGIQ